MAREASRSGPTLTAVATAFCDRCEVRSECLAAALEEPESARIWRGVTEQGRRVLRRGKRGLDDDMGAVLSYTLSYNWRLAVPPGIVFVGVVPAQDGARRPDSSH